MATHDQERGKTVEIRVPGHIASERLDKYLGNTPELKISRSRVQKLIGEGLVLVDGQSVAGKHLLKGGELIAVSVPPPPKTDLVGEALDLKIVYEDDHLAVVDKPAGMVTHPAVGNYSGTLVNALIFHFDRLAQRGGSDRPGIVHRLDKGTSGLLVVAKNDQAHAALQKAIQGRQLKRTYIALICGHMPQDEGTIDLPIGRSGRDRTRMVVTDRGSRPAVTQYRSTDRFRSYDLLEISLLTGRTHQIRVHFSHLGHPVFGDPEYGGREKWHRGVFGPDRPLARRLLGLIDRQALHSVRLEFAHPVSGELLGLDSKLPDDFGAVLDALERDGR